MGRPSKQPKYTVRTTSEVGGKDARPNLAKRYVGMLKPSSRPKTCLAAPPKPTQQAALFR